MKRKAIFLTAALTGLAYLSSMAAGVTHTVTSEYDSGKQAVVTTVSVSGDYGSGSGYLKTSVAVTDDAKAGGDKIKALKQINLDSAGLLDYSFNIQAPTGDYTLTVKTEGADTAYTADISLTDYSDDALVLNSLYAGTATPQSLVALLDDTTLELALDRGIYENLTAENKLLLADDYIVKIGQFTLEEYVQDFNDLSFEYGIASGSEPIIKHIIENYADRTPVVSSPYYSDYLALADKSAVYGIISASNYTTDAELLSAFAEGVAIAAVRNAQNKSEITPALNKYKDVLQYDTANTDYTAYESSVTGYIYTNLSSVTDKASLTTVISSGIDEAKLLYNENQGTTGTLPGTPAGGSGGGGGGGGGAIVSNASSVEVSSDLMNETTDDVDFTEKVKFEDVPAEHWANEAITSLALRNIVSGKGDGYYYPDTSITRAEFLKLATVAFNCDFVTTEEFFDDVNESDWFYPYVSAGYKAKLIEGTGAGFNPYANITRQDAFVILSRAVKAEEAGELAFADSEQIASYASAHINSLVNAGIVSGYTDNTVKPLNNISRAEAAQLIFNAVKAVAER